MSAPKFTPGPWGIGPKPTQVCSTPQGAMKYAPGGPYYHRLLADTAGKDARREDENVANARLMAAAPELLAAVEHAQAWVSDMPHGDNCYLSAHYEGDPGNQCNCGKESVLAALEAALAKAVQP